MLRLHGTVILVPVYYLVKIDKSRFIANEQFTEGATGLLALFRLFTRFTGSVTRSSVICSASRGLGGYHWLRFTVDD